MKALLILGMAFMSSQVMASEYLCKVTKFYLSGQQYTKEEIEKEKITVEITDKYIRRCFISENPFENNTKEESCNYWRVDATGKVGTTPTTYKYISFSHAGLDLELKLPELTFRDSTASYYRSSGQCVQTSQ